MNGIDIGLKEYNLNKVFIDSVNSEASSNKNELPTDHLQPISLALIETTIQDIDSTYEIRNNNDRISKLYILYVGSKFT